MPKTTKPEDCIPATTLLSSTVGNPSHNGTQRERGSTSRGRASRRWTHNSHGAAIAVRSRFCRCTCVKRGRRALTSPSHTMLNHVDTRQRPVYHSRQPRTTITYNTSPGRSTPLRDGRSKRDREVYTPQSHRRWSGSGYTMEYAHSPSRSDERGRLGR